MVRPDAVSLAARGMLPKLNKKEPVRRAAAASPRFVAAGARN